ncbi:MAG: SDR family oxidoreductase [Actinobacteria bacterium]|nr:SDR family oxidoreductase [Actinomycetota bacterium]
MTRPSILVTGAASGIGEAVLRLALEHGTTVLALDSDPQLPARHEGADGVVPVVVDLADPDATAAAVREVTADADLAGIVNNAGIGASAPFFETGLEVWERLHSVNLRAPLVVSAAAWPRLRKPGGAIVNVSSIHGRAALAGLAAYSASKSGVEGMTRAMALDAAPYGVRANTVAPGFVRTRLWSDWLDPLDDETRSGEESSIRAMIPLGRPAEPAEIAEIVWWLLSPASSYVTGATIQADGGLTARASYRPNH